MVMKRILCHIASFLILQSCVSLGNESEPVLLGVRLHLGLTKAVEESVIDHADIYVFNSSGALESSMATGNSSFELGLSYGWKDIFVIANSPVNVGSCDLGSLKSAVSSLEDNCDGLLIMTGSTRVNVEKGASVDIILERLCAKIEVRKIINAREDTLRIRKIYLSNLPGEVSMFSQEEVQPSIWLNTLGVSSDNPLYTSFSYTEVSDSVILGLPLYLYPNPVEENPYGGTWSPRHSRLVIQADAPDNGTEYYVFDLPVIERNKVYVFNSISIGRKGSKDPEIITSDCTGTLDVIEWNKGFSYKEML